MSGWYKLHRGWRDSEFFAAYKGQPLSEQEAWLWLIENAAWKDTIRSAYNGDAVQVKRGQIHTSLRSLQTAWNWDKSRVERYLNRLHQWSMIGMESGKVGRILTICNYAAFQDLQDTIREGGETHTGHLPRNPRDTQEEGKKKEGKKKEERNSSFVLPDWVSPKAWQEWEDHRKEIKAPLTDSSRVKCVKVLEEATRAGFSTEETIEQSIVSGWRGLFVPKGKPKPKVSDDTPDWMRRIIIENMRAAKEGQQ